MSCPLHVNFINFRIAGHIVEGKLITSHVAEEYDLHRDGFLSLPLQSGPFHNQSVIFGYQPIGLAGVSILDAEAGLCFLNLKRQSITKGWDAER